MDNINLTTQVDTMFANMEQFTQQDGLLGKPVTQGDKTFLPVMSLTFGYAGGDMLSRTKTQNPSMSGSSGALGAGAKLTTEAVIIIDKNNVMLAPVNTQLGGISQIINQIPQIVGNMGGKQNSQQQNSQQQNQQQMQQQPQQQQGQQQQQPQQQQATQSAQRGS
jgi:uncharacterized spore protein YtfJ